MGGLSLCMIYRENFENLPKNIQSHGVLDMKDWFKKINCLIILYKEHGQSFLYLLKILK